MERWVWAIQYGVGVLVMLALTALLGNSHLFQSAPLGRSDLSASSLVRFLGDSAALMLLWLMARRATRELRDEGGWQALVRAIAVPFATLMILLIGYGVPLFVLGPMLNDAGLAAYHWLFVIAVIAAALWLALVVYEHALLLTTVASTVARAVPRHLESESESASATALPSTGTEASRTRRCGQCGRELASDARSCSYCDVIAA
jgi:hypothetical protein